MMKKEMKACLYLSGLCILMMATAGCSSDDEKEPEDPKKEIVEPSQQQPEVTDVSRGINLTDSQKVAVGKNNDFAFELFRHIYQVPELRDKSIVTSPISCTYALGMVNSGAVGQTSREIVKMLGFEGGTSNEINELCKRLIIEAPLVDKQVTLKLANAVITDNQVALQEQYRKDVGSYYDAEVFSKDLSQTSTLTFINDWCSNHTEGMIRRILDTLEPSMRAVLLNAVFFKAEWASKFDKDETRDSIFTTENGSSQPLPMMHRYGSTGIFYNQVYGAVRLPYGQGDRWNMYVLLPLDGKTVADVLDCLTQKSWSEFKKQIVDMDIDLKLPRFKSESDINLNDVIKSMGTTTMFTPQADFSAMVSNMTEPFFVSLIKQKAAVEVTEEGTKAAAVTGLMWCSSPGDGEDPGIIKFHADHPFVYLIQEETSGAIFFIGTYMGENTQRV